MTVKSERRSASDMAAVLNNIRVVDFGHYIAGPLTAMLLADHGADVIHIDRPGSTHWKQPTDAYYNRGKRRITLDLKGPKDREVARRLVASADVVIENFRAGVMERLGIGAVASTAACPRLIYCSLPGFPADDPRAGVAAWEGVVQAATSGYRPLRAHYYAEYHNICVDDASRPLFTPIPLASNLAAMTAATSIVMALIARERTGRGQHVDISYLDTTLSLLAATPNMRFFFSDGVAPRRGEGFLGGSYPYYAIYTTRDGKLLTIGCTEPWLWENFCNAIGRPDFKRFARTSDQLVRAANAEEEAARSEIEALIKTRDRDEWYELLVKADVCVGKVYDIPEMVADPQINHRRMIVDVEHPTQGRVRQIGVAIKLSDTPGTIRSAAPMPNEHTEDVLKDLGMSAAEIADLRRKKVVE